MFDIRTLFWTSGHSVRHQDIVYLTSGHSVWNQDTMCLTSGHSVLDIGILCWHRHKVFDTGHGVFDIRTHWVGHQDSVLDIRAQCV